MFHFVRHHTDTDSNARWGTFYTPHGPVETPAFMPVGTIGTVLGENKINIAGMTFGRIKPGGDAITVLNIDSKPDAKILEHLRKNKNINDVKAMRL